MSFRLQRQKASRPSLVKPWVLTGVLSLAGGWLWLQRPSPVIAEIPAQAPMAAETVSAPVLLASAIEADTTAVFVNPQAPVVEVLPVKNQPLSYAFHFEGKAYVDGKPCAKTRLRLQLTQGSRRRTLETITDQEGAYSIVLHMNARPNRVVDWSLAPVEEKFLPLEVTGREIVLPSRPLVQLEQSLHLLSA